MSKSKLKSYKHRKTSISASCFVQHQYLAARRSTFWQKSVIINILLGIISTLILLSIILIGWHLDELIQDIFGESNTISLLSGFLMFYFLFDLFARFMMQKTTQLNHQPYLLLPIKKRKLLHFTLRKTLFSFFNLLPLCLFVPYFIKVIIPTTSLDFSVGWLISVLSFVLTNNFLSVVLKKQYAQNPLIIAISIITLGILLYFNYATLIDFSNYFSALLFWIASKPWRYAIPIVLVTLSYYIAYRTLRKQMYLQESGNIRNKYYGKPSLINNHGQVTDLLILELKMLWRNKRPKATMLMSVFFFVYGVFLYIQNLNSEVLASIIILFCVASFPLMYGQLIFSWDSSYFGFYLTNKFSYLNYLKAKYLLFIALTIISCVLALPVVLWHSGALIIITAWFFYLTGLVNIITLFLACFKEKHISLDRGLMMNYEGLNFVGFFMIVAVILLPLILYYALNYFGLSDYTFFIIAALGGLALLFQPLLLQQVLHLFEKHRYKMTEGFRIK